MGNLLSVDEVAKRLQISPSMVRQWVREGRLPAIRPSRRVTRIPEEALETLLGLGNRQDEHINWETSGHRDGVVITTSGQLARIVETAVRKAVKEALASAPTGDGDNGGLLTPDEVARRLGVSRDTVYLWVKKGRLPAVRPSPRVIRIPEAALEGAPYAGRAAEEVGANEQH